MAKQLPKDLVKVLDEIVPSRISEILAEAQLFAEGGPISYSPEEYKKRLKELEKFLSLLTKDNETMEILRELNRKVEEFTSMESPGPVSNVAAKGKILNLAKIDR